MGVAVCEESLGLKNLLPWQLQKHQMQVSVAVCGPVQRASIRDHCQVHSHHPVVRYNHGFRSRHANTHLGVLGLALESVLG